MSSEVLKENKTDRDLIKNITNFFHESINNFKSTLAELSISIENFLRSLESIERQLEDQGFECEENSSFLLYERLTKGKQAREQTQKDLIHKLTKRLAHAQSGIPENPEEGNEQVELTSPPKPPSQFIEELKTTPITKEVRKIADLRQAPPKAEQIEQKQAEQVINVEMAQMSEPSASNKVKIDDLPIIKDATLKSPEDFSKSTLITENLKNEMLDSLKKLKKMMKDQ